MFGLFLIPAAGLGFFFGAWILMLFWGSVASWFDGPTLSYVNSLWVNLGLWASVCPLVIGAFRKMS